MNSVLSVRQVYEQGRNIYDDVKNFQEKDFHSEPFCQVMQWLKECIMMQGLVDELEVESRFVLQCQEHQIVFEADIKENHCKIITIRYQNAQGERVNGIVNS